MPPLTRESRALLSFSLSLGLVVGGLSDLGFSLYAAVASVLGDFVPGNQGVGVGIALATLALSVGLHLLARSSVRGDDVDVWRHLGVAATWVSLLLVVVSVAALLGAIGANWPVSRSF